MKTYISPIGFDTTHLLSLLVRFGIESNDSIILIRPIDDDDRSFRAIEEIQELTRKIGDGITIDILKVDHRDFMSMVFVFIRSLSESAGKPGNNDKLYVNLSGGPREILIALTTASITVSDKIDLVTSFSDIGRDLQIISLPYIANSPDEKEYYLLHDIKKNGPTSFADIASRLQISESTISRQCSRLSGLQWITVESRGKNKFASISPSGEIMIMRYNPPKDNVV
ncbi:CRISPR locus-related DNA-binding protein [Methanospirillum purgamenti]|uniref:CRISPR locus-related DNA-binding protein n=1 Tax=Methanospirillum hungatei TaxID=2203 RepID=A0A8F5ZF74_METHU|nr:CRISPR-associated CARF protein Csa3 [Methanospirillum hungatei]QXO94209.1 CRISPR locus-related DNA-binding protein [Methanospirillum hungatei]